MGHRIISTNEAFKYHWMVWKLTGIKAPDGFPQHLYTVYTIFINFVVTIMFPFTLVMNLFYTVGLQEVCENLTMTITDTISNLKFLNVFFVRSKLLAITDIVNKLDVRARGNPEQVKVLEKSIDVAQKSFKIFWCLYTFGTCLSLCKILIASERTLLYPAWIPLNWKESLVQYSVALGYQLFGLIVQAIQDVANDSYPPAYLCVLTGHIRALGLRVRQIGRSNNDLEENYTVLISCIQDHQNILELCDTIQKIISITCLAQFLCSALVQCTVGVYFLFIMEDRNISSLLLSGIFFLAVTLEIFILCYFGHALKLESEHLIDDLYACYWTEQLPKFKKSLRFFMMQTHRRNVILAGNYIPVDFPTFLLIMKYSYSVFTLLVRFK